MPTSTAHDDQKLVGRELCVIVNDPWEFSSVWGTWRQATIERVGRAHAAPEASAVLIRLAMPVEYQGMSCEYFVASPRYAGQEINALETQESLEASLTCVPQPKVTDGDPFDLGWWRGGAAGIATLRWP